MSTFGGAWVFHRCLLNVSNRAELSHIYTATLQSMELEFDEFCSVRGSVHLNQNSVIMGGIRAST